MDDLYFIVIENFPNMIFLKNAEKENRKNFDKGFKYVYFNSIMDHSSGFNRNDMIGNNKEELIG